MTATPEMTIILAISKSLKEHRGSAAGLLPRWGTLLLGPFCTKPLRESGHSLWALGHLAERKRHRRQVDRGWYLSDALSYRLLAEPSLSLISGCELATLGSRVRAAYFDRLSDEPSCQPCETTSASWRNGGYIGIHASFAAPMKTGKVWSRF